MVETEAQNVVETEENLVENKIQTAETKELLTTFANSLDPDYDRQNVRPDLDPNCLTL